MNGRTELTMNVNAIETEIMEYLKQKGDKAAILKIGRRLIHVRNNRLTQDFIGWYEGLGIKRRNVNEYIKVTEELGEDIFNYRQGALNTLYEVANIPKEERDKPHTIPNTGKIKLVKDMTAGEIKEVKKMLRQAQKQAEKREGTQGDIIPIAPPTPEQEAEIENIFSEPIAEPVVEQPTPSKRDVTIVQPLAGSIATEKLNPHPKNGYYFTDLDGEKYEEVKRSIATYGIRDPLKITTNYTIISGHQRFRIAKDLGLTEIPVTIMDVDEWEAEYLLIAENTERRGEAEKDPIKKARIAKFLTEYWDVKHGGNRASGHNGHLKTTADIAEALGESEKTTRRLIKLNDLIPELQQLVSDGKLGTTAGEQLAYLTEEAQRELWGKLGEGIGDKTVKEVTELRRQIEDKDSIIDELKSELQAKGADKPLEPQVLEKEVIVEKPVYKEVMPEDIQQRLEQAERRAKNAESERNKLNTSLAQARNRLDELERLEQATKSQTESPIYNLYRTMLGMEGYLQAFTGEEGLAEVLVANSDPDFVVKFKAVLGRIKSLVEQADWVVNETVGGDSKGTTIDIEYKSIERGSE